MAKTLSFTDTSPQTVKIGDTTTSFTLICGNDNVATDLTNATSITVKLGNTSGYLKSATVDPTSLTDPTTGQVTVTFNVDLMTSLPAGSYAIEVWVVDSTGTSIYPSDGSTGFAITNNIQSANGATITTITFDDFVEAMNKAASTIAKGDKGDKGDTGPQGVMTNDQVNTLIDNKIKYTSIPNGTDLFTHINNTGNTEHLCVNSNAAAISLLNCPVTTVFTLDIKTASPANRPTGSSGGPTWVYNQFELHPYQSSDIYTTAIETDGNGAFITHPWKKLVTQTSGTLDVTSAFYKSGTTSSSKALNYVLTGNILHVSGAVVPSSEIVAGTSTVLFNLPSSIGTIAENIAVVQQSSGWNIYCLSCNPNGAVSVLKHNNAGTATAITTTTVLQVSVDILLS
ncbi:collagen-like protein [Lactiplantibacillus plantarum]|uniref:collagen-like protein n=1 Tax=Lactiplantibacillus plantarum TaxID=1590 RepID=UPI001F4C8CF5|nr:collagen-like protein [Lactiplantibacillus plantarum]MCH8629846.1 collagen-like protein [Lactiplantibacillus plantarum]MCH8632520.1 collagen-like protein [Lactiplantibacillus plantarum]